VLRCRDPEAAARFYVDLLGARMVADAAPWGATCAVAFDEQVIALRAAGRSERSVLGGIYDAVGLRVVALLVDDIDALCARLEEAGRRVAEGVALPGQGAIRFAKDVDGCMLELIALTAKPPPRARMQVGLTVAAASASRRFYGETLGLAEQPPVPISRGITRHGFDVGGSTLTLWQPTRQPAPRPPETEPGLEAVAFRVASLGDTLDTLNARGAAPIPDPSSARPMCLLRDPDGNAIELIESSTARPAD
jgi:catechol 2,3-dioxygenase-like lactoylglutathione lyase family enzyme